MLLVIGALTVPAMTAGWWAIRRRRSTPPDRATLRSWLLGAHIVLIGSTYIAAWTAFLLNNPIFGVGTRWHVLAYRFGPTLIGTVLIARARRRYRRRDHPRPTAQTGAVDAHGALGNS